MADWLARLRGVWRRGLAAIALLIFTISAISCSQLPTQTKVSQNLQNGAISKFVPRQAVLAAAIDTTVEPGKAWQRSGITDAAYEAISSLLAPLAVELSEDVRPWLGNQLVFAITDKDLDLNHQNRRTGYLLVAETSDGERLREFLELFWQRQAVAGSQPRFTTMNGVPIISGVIDKEKRSLATAVIGETVLLVANDASVLQQSLRVAQTPALQLSRLQGTKPVRIHLRIPEFLDWLGLATSAKQVFMSSSPWQHLTAVTEIQPQGLEVMTQLSSLKRDRTANNKPDTDIRVPDDGPQQYLPASIAWAATGQDLLPLWEGFWDEIEHYQNLPPFLQQWQAWHQSEIAQTLKYPLTQLLAGPYAIGQLEDGTWLMVTANSSSATIDQLDHIAEQQGLTVSHLALKGRSVTAWSRLRTSLDTRNRETTVETDLIALHTKVGDYNLFATSLGGLTAAFEAPANGLLATQRFQRAAQLLDTPNQGYFYGTWDKVERLLASNRWFSLVQPIVQPWIQSIDTISVTNYEHTSAQSTGMVSILLKK